MAQTRSETLAALRRRRGHSVLEVTFLAPWFFFLFAGAFDMGFYSVAIISTQNAARVASIHTSSNASTAADSAAACQYALAELRSLPNVRSLNSCAALPLQVTASAVTGADGAPASQVSVTYQTPALIPIPNLRGQFTFTRTAQMRVKGS